MEINESIRKILLVVSNAAFIKYINEPDRINNEFFSNWHNNDLEIADLILFI